MLGGGRLSGFRLPPPRSPDTQGLLGQACANAWEQTDGTSGTEGAPTRREGNLPGNTRRRVQRPSTRGPAPSPRTLPPLGCRGRGCHSGRFFRAWGAALAPPLLWRPRLAAAGSRRIHTGGRGGRSAACPARPWSLRPGDADRACAREAVQKGRVRARPRAEKQRRLQAVSQTASSALTQPSRGPASPAQALAAEQHGELRLALGMRDVRRRTPRIGQVGGACKE